MFKMFYIIFSLLMAFKSYPLKKVVEFTQFTHLNLAFIIQAELQARFFPLIGWRSLSLIVCYRGVVWYTQVLKHRKIRKLSSYRVQSHFEALFLHSDHICAVPARYVLKRTHREMRAKRRVIS
jgi:hypothetical protein